MYLPDKEFRYLRHYCYSSKKPSTGQIVSVPSGSPRRHGGRTISSSPTETSSVWPLRIPGHLPRPFLLIVCTRHVVTVPTTSDGTSSAGYSEFPAYGWILQRPIS